MQTSSSKISLKINDRLKQNVNIKENKDQFQQQMRESQIIIADLEKHLTKYEKLRINYQDKISFLQTRALKRMSYEICHRNVEFNVVPVLKQMCTLTKQLMLNEIETVYWYNTNDFLELNQIEIGKFSNILLMSALFSKKQLISKNDGETYEAFLTHNYPFFMLSYKEWEENLQKKLLLSKQQQSRRDNESEEELVPDKYPYSLGSINSTFYFLFAECENKETHPSDFQEDFNYIVDSLEEEHIRRSVHTTKNVEEEEKEIQEQNREETLQSIKISSESPISQQQGQDKKQIKDKYLKQENKREEKTKIIIKKKTNENKRKEVTFQKIQNIKNQMQEENKLKIGRQEVEQPLINIHFPKMEDNDYNPVQINNQNEDLKQKPKSNIQILGQAANSVEKGKLKSEESRKKEQNINKGEQIKIIQPMQNEINTHNSAFTHNSANNFIFPLAGSQQFGSFYGGNMFYPSTINTSLASAPHTINNFYLLSDKTYGVPLTGYQNSKADLSQQQQQQIASTNNTSQSQLQFLQPNYGLLAQQFPSFSNASRSKEFLIGGDIDKVQKLTPNQNDKIKSPLSFSSQVSNFIYPFSTGQHQPSTLVNNVGLLPDFGDRNSFPTFFLGKSGSFEKSPQNSFVIYPKTFPAFTNQQNAPIVSPNNNIQSQVGKNQGGQNQKNQEKK